MGRVATLIRLPKALSNLALKTSRDGHPQLFSIQSFMRAEQRSRITSITLLVTLDLMQPRVQFFVWAGSTHCWLMLSFSATSTPKSFSAGLFSIYLLPGLYSCLGLPVVLLDLLRFAQPFSEAFYGPSEWLPFHPICQPLYSTWCFLQTCWGFTQSCWQCHQQRHR